MVTLDTGQASDLWAGAREYWEEVVSCSVAERHPPGLQATLPTAAVLTQYHIQHTTCPTYGNLEQKSIKTATG